MDLPIPSATDPDVVAAYARDETHLMEPGRPAAVVRPESVEEVQEILRWAQFQGAAVVPRGGGTGLTGAAVAPEGSVVVSTERLNRIREVAPDERVAVAEAGVINADLNRACGVHGLMWAPDPASWNTSTVGGNVATNAGGLRCLRYGATRANVLGIEAVLIDGRILRTGGRTMKRSAGYDLTQLLIGSEGTLGLVTAVVAKLLPAPPPQVTAMATFADAAAAAEAAAELAIAHGITMIELLDRSMIAALEVHRSVGFGDAGAVLLVQADDSSRSTGSLERALVRGLDVALTADEAEADLLLDIRRSTYPALRRLGPLLVEDVAVPTARLPALLAAIETAATHHDITIATVAHAGEGNAHPTLVLDDRPHPEERAWAAAGDIFEAAQRLGGTVSGEHGIGRLKREWLATEIGEVSLDIHRAVKRAFDPGGLMNPGAVFRLDGPSGATTGAC